MKETHKIGQIGVSIHVHYFHNQRWRDAVSISQTIRLLFGAVYHCRRRTGKMVTYIEGAVFFSPLRFRGLKVPSWDVPSHFTRHATNSAMKRQWLTIATVIGPPPLAS